MIYIYINDGSKYYFDIMTVKNNLKSCEVLKLKLLRWIALQLGKSKDMNEVKNLRINTFIAIPYNPYFPENYFEKQWISTILDSENDVMVKMDFGIF